MIMVVTAVLCAMHGWMVGELTRLSLILELGGPLAKGDEVRLKALKHEEGNLISLAQPDRLSVVHG